MTWVAEFPADAAWQVWVRQYGGYGKIAAAVDEVPTMLPVVVEAPDSDVEIGGRGVRILLPGDDGYDDALAAYSWQLVDPSAAAGATLATP